MKRLKWILALVPVLALGVKLAWSDASPNYIEEYNGNGTNHNTRVWSIDYNGNSFQLGNSQITGSEADTSTTLTLSSTTMITTAATYEILNSTAGSILISAAPSINTTGVNDGQYLVLGTTGCPSGQTSVNTSSVTLQDMGTLTGSGLHLGATTRAVTCNNVLTLIYNAVAKAWFETGFVAGK